MRVHHLRSRSSSIPPWFSPTRLKASQPKNPHSSHSGRHDQHPETEKNGNQKIQDYQ